MDSDKISAELSALDELISRLPVAGHPIEAQQLRQAKLRRAMLAAELRRLRGEL
jgi:hypothetical protein